MVASKPSLWVRFFLGRHCSRRVVGGDRRCLRLPAPWAYDATTPARAGAPRRPHMPRNKQLDRLAQIIRTLEQGLRGSVAALQKNISALTSGGGIASAKPRKDLIRALERLRAALNKAI